MSVPIASVSVEQKISVEQRKAATEALMRAINNMRDNVAVDNALQNGAYVNAIGVQWSDKEKPTSSTLLLEAIERNYTYAATKLIFQENIDLSNGSNYIITAVLEGNSDIVAALLKKDKKLIKTKTGTGNSLLHLALTRFSSRSLIFDGISKHKESLKKYFSCQQNLSTEVVDDVQILYRGNIPLINVLLECLPDKSTMLDAPGSADMDFCSPLEIVRNPKKIKDKFTDVEGNSSIRCLTTDMNAVTEQSLVHRVTLSDCSGNDSFFATVTTDFSALRKILEDKAKLLSQGSTTKQVDENTKAIHALKTEAADAKKKSEEQHKHVQKQMAPLLGDKFQKDNLEKQQKEFDKNPILNAFGNAFNTKLAGGLLGSKAVSGGNVQRAQNTTVDKAVSGLKFISDCIPLFGKVTGALAAGIQLFNNWDEEKKHTAMARCFKSTNESDTLSQELTIELIKKCKFLQHPAIMGNPKAAADFGEKVAAAAYLFILNIINEVDQKPSLITVLQNKQTLKQLVFTDLLKSDLLKDKFEAHRKVTDNSIVKTGQGKVGTGAMLTSFNSKVAIIVKQGASGGAGPSGFLNSSSSSSSAAQPGQKSPQEPKKQSVFSPTN